MTQAIKAIRAKIKLGDIALDVFQLPDGQYRYSQTDAFMSIADEGYYTKQAAKRYIEKTTSKQAQTLIPQGFSCIEKVKIEGENQTFNAISQADVSNLWLLFAMNGNAKAVRLLSALAQEGLERRADVAFGVVRSEEERNARLEFRIQTKMTRRTLTDSIKEYIARHPELSDNYPKFVYSNCSDHLNLVVLGAKSKQVKAELDLKQTGLLRDVIPFASLRELEAIENVAGRLIDAEDLEPLEAVKKAISIMHAKTLGYQ